MYQDYLKDEELQVAIYSFKNRKDGYLLFNIKENKEANEIINQEIIEAFKEELIQLILEILNPDIDLIEENI